MFYVELVTKINRLIEAEKEAFYYSDEAKDEIGKAQAVGALAAYNHILDELKESEQKKWLLVLGTKDNESKGSK